MCIQALLSPCGGSHTPEISCAHMGGAHTPELSRACVGGLCAPKLSCACVYVGDCVYLSSSLHMWGAAHTQALPCTHGEGHEHPSSPMRAWEPCILRFSRA